MEKEKTKAEIGKDDFDWAIASMFFVLVVAVTVIYITEKDAVILIPLLLLSLGAYFIVIKKIRRQHIREYSVLFGLMMFSMALAYLVFYFMHGHVSADRSELETFGEGVLIAIIGAYYFKKGFGNWSLYNTILNAHASNIRGLAAGFVEVYGEAVPKDDYIKAPFSGEECAYYRYDVSDLTEGERLESKEDATIKDRILNSEKSWEIVKEGRSDVTFLVDDGTGKVEVDPQDAKFEIGDKFEVIVKPGEEPIPRVKKFIKENNLEYKKSLVRGGLFYMQTREGTRRYRQYILGGRSKVFVAGNAVPKEGVRSPRHEEMLTIKKSTPHDFLYISDSEEKKILNDMTNRAMLNLIGGGILAILGVAVALARLGVL